MSKVVFFGTPAHGHINPTLPLVTELVMRGEEVIYYSLKDFQSKISSTNAQYKDYEFTDTFDADSLGKNLADLYYGLISITKNILPRLLQDIEIINPDYIIHDSIAVWGRYIATIKKIPAISSVSTFAYSKRTINIFNTLNFISKVKIAGILKMSQAMILQKELFLLYGVKPRLFIDTVMNEEPLNIVYCSKAFHPRVKDFDPEKYKFVGPIISERINDSDTTDYSKMRHPLIYISMGTIWKDQYSIDTIIESLDDIEGTLIFSGTAKELMKKNTSSNIVIKEHINQLEVLKYSDVFITHGGMNSVNEALYNTVPLCVHPFQSEQEEVAQQIVKMNCGVKIKKLTKKAINSAVKEILRHKKYKHNCITISASFRESGGYTDATNAIFSHIEAVRIER